MNRSRLAAICASAASLVVLSLAGSAPAGATTPTLGPLTVSGGAVAVAHGGAAETVTGTVAGGAGDAVDLVLQSVSGAQTLASATIASDGTWRIDTTMPAGPDGGVPVSVVVQTATDYLSASLNWFRQTDTTTTAIVNPVSGHITSTVSNAIDGLVEVENPGFVTYLHPDAVIVQGTHAVTPLQTLTYGVASGAAKAGAGFSVPVGSLANGPALLVVSSYSSDLTTTKLAVLPLQIDLATQANVGAGQTATMGAGFVEVSVQAQLFDPGPDTAATYSLDGGAPVALTHVNGVPDTGTWAAYTTVFDVPAADTVGTQLIADGPHSVHVHLVSRGKASDYDVPVTVDTTPSMTIDSMLVNFGNGGTFNVDMTGHVNGMHLTTAVWTALTPDGMTVVSGQKPVLTTTGSADSTTWKSRVIVASYAPYGSRLALQLALTDMHGGAHCYWAVLTADSLGGIADCGATAPGTPTASRAFASDGILVSATVPTNGGPTVEYVVYGTATDDANGAPVVQFPYAGSDPMPLGFPSPPAGTMWYLHLKAINVMGTSPTVDLGPVMQSALTRSTPPAKLVDGKPIALSGTVTATVPGAAATPLPASSLSLHCYASGPKAWSTRVFSPATSTAAYSVSFVPRGTTSCSVAFAGDTVHGLSYASTSTFMVRVIPAVSAKPTVSKVRRGRGDKVTVSMSPIGRDTWVYLDQWNGKKWVHIDYVRAKGHAAVTFTVTKKKAGTYTYRAIVPYTDYHETGSTRGFTIKVV